MIFLDSNIFIKYFQGKEEHYSEKLEVFFNNIVGGKIISFINSMVIAEIIWVLDRVYSWNKDEICDNIDFILNTPNIKIKERNILAEAIKIFRKNNIDFIDSYNYAYIKNLKSNQIYSYDKDFEKLSDIQRLDP
jgi:predicted nucleic-acid-binding protein